MNDYSVFVNRGFTTVDEYDNISRYEENIASDAYREYRRKWAENPKKLILEEGPLHIDIDPTNFCNLKCKMCPRVVTKTHENEKLSYMDFDLFKDIVNQAKALGVPSVKFGILTEPLVHPQFVEMIQYVKKTGFEDIGVVTNATLLNEDLAKGLIEAGLVKINVSFDSPVKETYESIRIGASFEKTIANMKRLIEIRNNMNSPTPLLRVTMVKMKENKPERQLFYDLFKPFADRIAFLDYEEYDDALADSTVLDYEEFDNYACSELWLRLTIDSKGMVYPCCSGTIYRDFAWDFKRFGMKAIWQDKVEVLRDAFSNNTWKQIPMCKKCLSRIKSLSTLDDGKV